MIRVTIPGKPEAMRRKRMVKMGKHVRLHTDRKDGMWAGRAQIHMAEAMGDRPPLEGPLRVVVVAYFELAKSHHRKRTPVPERWSENPKDWDNIGKIVSDAGNGILWLDDRQVADGRVQKIQAAQGEPARVEVTVERLEER